MLKLFRIFFVLFCFVLFFFFFLLLFLFVCVSFLFCFCFCFVLCVCGCACVWGVGCVCVCVCVCVFTSCFFHKNVTTLILTCIMIAWERAWHNGRVLAWGVEGLWIENCTGPKISCYACCATWARSYKWIWAPLDALKSAITQFTFHFIMIA